MKKTGINHATLKRLPVYMKLLTELCLHGRGVVSTRRFVSESNIPADDVLQDLSALGVLISEDVFSIRSLIEAIENVLGVNNTDAFLMSSAQDAESILKEQSFDNINIVAVFSSAENEIGRTVCGREIYSTDMIDKFTRRLHVHKGIIGGSVKDPQGAADKMTAAGIIEIWSDCEVSLSVPEYVQVRSVISKAAISEITLAGEKE